MGARGKQCVGKCRGGNILRRRVVNIREGLCGGSCLGSGGGGGLCVLVAWCGWAPHPCGGVVLILRGIVWG